MSNNQLAEILTDARKVSVRQYKNSSSTNYATGASKLVTWAKARGLNPNDAETRKEHSRFCNRENAKLAGTISYLTSEEGLVLDKVTDKVDTDGVRQAFTIKLVRPSVPKAKSKAEKVSDIFANLSDEDKAEVIALMKSKVQPTIEA